MASKAFLQQAYLAYFGRPADPSGLAYYAEKTEAQVKAAFSASPESQAFFGSMAVAAQINTIYQNLFNRDAEPAGLAYWSQEIGSGRLSLADAAMGILAGAQNDDKTAVTNKLAASDAFTAKLDTTAEILGYAGSAAISPARAYLKAVDATAASLTTATTGVDASVASVVAAGSGSTNVGQTFTLTTSVDNLTGTAGNDTFTADNTVNSELSVADVIDGGAGTDTLNIYADGNPGFTIGENIKNIENLYVNGQSGDLNVANNGFTAVEIDSATTTAAGADTITVAAGQTITLDSIVDGDLTNDANNKGEIEITGATSVTSASLVVDGVGASTLTSANDDLDIDITSASITSLSIKSQGTVSTDKNYVGIQNGGAKLDTLTITGDKLLDAREDAVTTLKTINASGSTGGVVVNVTGSTLDVTFTGGTGGDTLIVGADLDTNDVIDGGDGTDTVVISDATLTASTLAAVKGANALKNVEVLGVSATSTITIDASIFTDINTFANTATVVGTAGVSGTSNGGDGVNLTFQSGDAFTITAALTGGAGDASAGTTDGGDALEVAAKVNSGSDAITITLNAGAGVTLTGGAGGEGSGGDGGHGINASSVETINIVTASSKDDLTLAGGASGGSAGGGETAGSGLSVGANATINISGAGDVDLGGLIKTQGAAVDDLTVDGSNMSGILTVVTGDGNDIIKGGSAADVITAGTGTNTVTGNGGADEFRFADDASKHTAMTTITDFQMGAGKDVIKFTTTAGVFEALTSANATALAGLASTATLADALEVVDGQLAEHEATVFVFQGNAYVIYEEADDSDGYTEANYSVVKLAGITDVTAFDPTNIA